MDFWSRLVNLIAENGIVIDRPRGSRHPRYPEIVYPLDYGYIKDTSGGDGNEIDVWRGSLNDDRLVAIICTIDTMKRDTEVKLIIGCTAGEIEVIRAFHNDNEFISGIVVNRF